MLIALVACVLTGASPSPRRRHRDQPAAEVGAWVYAQALETGKGRSIPTDWLPQDIRD